MNRIYKKIIPLCISAFAITAGHAQNMETSDTEMKTKSTPQYRQCDSCQPAEVCEPCPCDKIVEEPLMCAYNAPVTSLIKCPWNVGISASFIYWQAKEKGLDLGDTDNCDVCCPGKVINMDFDFKPGFKVGIGMLSEYDNWHLNLEYTRLHLTNTTSYAIKNDCDCACDCPDDCEAFPPCVIINPSYSLAEGDFVMNKAHGKWTMNLDLIDLDLGRHYWVGTQLTFNTFVGLRGGWIDQKMDAKYYTVQDNGQGCSVPSCTIYGSNNKSDSWLIGPRVGVDTNWMFAEGFRLFGNTAFSLFYQDFKTKIFEYSEDSVCCDPCACACPSPCKTCEENNLHDDVSYITPNLEIALGLAYGRYLDCYKWYVDLSVGYEFHAFWNQNMMRNIWDKGYHSHQDTDAGDLFLHGLTITAKLAF